MRQRKNITNRSIWYITTGHAKAILKTSDLSNITPYKAKGRRNTFYAITEVLAEAHRRGIYIDRESIDQEMFSGGYPPADKTPKTAPQPVGKTTILPAPGSELPMEPTTLSLIAYVDGSFNSATKIYGSAIVMLDPEGREILKTSFPGQKYNEMWQVAGELRAAIAAVTYAEEYMADELLIRYDYEGIEKWATGEWRTKKEATLKYAEYMTKPRKMRISFEHVKAHTGDKYNEMVDDMAKEAAGVTKNIPPAYGEPVTLLSSDTLLSDFQIKLECLKDIEAFKQKEKKSFGDYLKIRVHGTDRLSDFRSVDDFKEVLSDKELEFLQRFSERDDQLLQACRWTVRGLAPEDAIRKAQVDAEIALKNNR